VTESARTMHEVELRLVKRLLRDTPNAAQLAKTINDLQVIDADDGGMGSFTVVSTRRQPRVASQLAELTFNDVDNVPVSVTLNVDQFGELFELDVFKGDFSPVHQIPDPLP
jgi:hypothetical protein